MREQLHFHSASRIVGTKDVGILLLLDEDERRQLVITCDNYTLHDINLRLNGDADNKQRLPEALWNMLGEVSHDHFEVFISGVDHGEYTTFLIDTDGLAMVPLRAADAVLLAVAKRLPIYVDSTLMKQQSVPFNPGSNGLAIPVNTLSDEMLRDALDKAVASENYELAAYLRDEIRYRERRSAKNKE